MLFYLYHYGCGCTNPDACNYDLDAITDDGNCLFPLDCHFDLNQDGIVNTADLLLFPPYFGTITEVCTRLDFNGDLYVNTPDLF